MNATFQITVNPDNYDTAIETYKYMRDKLKIQNINCTMIRGEKADSLDLLTRQKISGIYKEIQTMLDEDFDCGKVKGFYDNSLTSILLNAKNKIIWKYVLKTFNDKKYISPCTAGSLFGVIYSDGSVFPCELLDTKIATLQDYDYNFMKCWQSNNAKLIRNQIKKSKCHCTFECSWLVNIYSSPRYFAEILYNIVKNLRRKNYE